MLEAINEVALMGGAYNGYDDLMSAPAWHVARTRLVLAGKAQAEAEQAKEMQESSGNGGSSGGAGKAGTGGSGTGTGETRVSAYYPHQDR